MNGFQNGHHFVQFLYSPDHSKTELFGRQLVFKPFKNQILKHSVFKWVWFSSGFGIQAFSIKASMYPALVA